MADGTTDTFDGPRRDEIRDPDAAGPAVGKEATTEERILQVDLHLRARKLKHLNEQDAMVARANDITRWP